MADEAVFKFEIPTDMIRIPETDGILVHNDYSRGVHVIAIRAKYFHELPEQRARAVELLRWMATCIENGKWTDYPV